MRIGIDFDNTLACYQHVFAEVASLLDLVEPNWSGTKFELRELLRLKENGEKKWQQLQGQVYGKYIERAELFPGAANFLLRLKQRCWPIVIVSHKTKFGHYDHDRVPLRQAALDWMENKKCFGNDGLGLKEQNVHFANTREEKVQIIAEQGCDVFIDDLWEVFSELNFPYQTQRILFSKACDSKNSDYNLVSESWREISQFLLGIETETEIQYWADYVLNSVTDSCKQLAGRGNSRIYRVAHRGTDYVLKYYPDLARDPRERLKTESRTSKFLVDNGLQNVLVCEGVEPELSIGWYKWIPGKAVQKIDESLLDQAINFVEQLKKLRINPDAKFLPQAAEACLSFENLNYQLDRRLESLEKLQNPDLETFFSTEWQPLYKQSLLSPKIDLGELPYIYQTLSPSDFGFHNALELSEGKIYWLDFEYFGWDDPVKLICDFLWHPAMELSHELKQQWVSKCCQIFGDDPHLQIRLKRDWSFYGLRWTLILLNEFLPHQWNQRMRAQQLDIDHRQEIQQKQLDKARVICKLLRKEQLTIPYLN